MNFINYVNKGQEGKNMGRTTGSIQLDKMTLGIKNGTTGAIAGGEKAGKSKFCRYHYITMPYIHGTLKGLPYEWIVFSFEANLITVQADVCSTLISHFFNVKISPNKIMGLEFDDNGNQIKLTYQEKEIIKEVYNKHLTVLFGTFDANGNQTLPGLIKVYTSSVSPYEYEKILLDYARSRGKINDEFIKGENGKTKKIISNFVPHDENLIPIVIVDDYRLMSSIGTDKKTIDVALSLERSIVESMRWFFIVGIIHLNRDVTNFERIKTQGTSKYYPTSRDTKDTGNIGERKYWLINLFTPMNPDFNIPVHFGVKVQNTKYKTMHLVASRETEFPQHCGMTFEYQDCSFFNYNALL